MAVPQESAYYYFPIRENEINLGDIIYVPDVVEEDPHLGKQFGGWATVQSIRIGAQNIRYITISEWSGYFEINWDSTLKPHQTDLAQFYGLNRAYLCSSEVLEYNSGT